MISSRCTRTLAVASWAVAVLWAASARGQGSCPERPADAEKAKTLASTWFRKGTALYEAGEYKKALATFLCTNRIVPNRMTQYLIGLSAEKSGLFRVALSTYKGLKENPPESVKPEEIGRRIADLEKRIQAATARVPSVAPRKPPETREKPKVEPRKPPAVADSPATRPHVDTSGLRKAGWATMGVAIAMAAASVAVGVTVAVDKKKIENAPDGTPWYPSLDERHARMKVSNVTLGVCLGLGAASAVTSVVLFLVKSKKEKAAQVGVVPTGRGAVAAFGGRF